MVPPPVYYYFHSNLISSIENLVINTYFSIETFYDVLGVMDKFRSLSIDLLTDSNDWYEPRSSLNLPSFKNLRKICIKLKKIDFNKFQNIVKNVFKFIEILFISIDDNDEEYLYTEIAYLWYLS
ncbi:unnamed protein product [Adineta steineri]|uniref:Uncharacterized protein n=1 Tax=Adineta steineri TaxID=433720 RepID=A0A814ABJ0_9BILA|nr:unnamed protein product [Adineta steineri]CAF0840062.1 unnamed protein product [Adineta steineri]CAF0909567.1 unnamed protein product [Adineta steineri]